MGIGFWEKEEIKVHGIRILGNEWKPKEEYRREKWTMVSFLAHYK